MGHLRQLAMLGAAALAVVTAARVSDLGERVLPREAAPIASASRPAPTASTVTSAPAQAALQLVQAPLPAAPPDAAVVLDDALFALRNGANPAAVLAKLRAHLRAAAPEEAASAVMDFLASGADVGTGLVFAVGEGGVLSSAPSLRVALMDVLPALDPDAALSSARVTMDARTTSEEYVISLRNMAWNDYEGDLRNELSARFVSMLGESSWRARPSAAFLEGFDIAVSAGDRPAIDALASVITPKAGNASARALNRAAFIALDRIALRDPATLVELAAAPPAALAANPDLRASLYSRLDISNSAQREAFSTYLADPTVGASERAYLAELFPYGNYTHGPRLVSGAESSPSIAERAALDARVETELVNLAANTSPGPVADTIERIRARLADYLAMPR